MLVATILVLALLTGLVAACCSALHRVPSLHYLLPLFLPLPFLEAVLAGILLVKILKSQLAVQFSM